MTGSSTEAARWDHIVNFRDAACSGPANGLRLRRGKLLRAGLRDTPTDSDQARLARIGVTAIVDLRMTSERKMHPWSTDRFGIVCFAHDYELDRSAYDNRARGGVLPHGTARGVMLDYYRQLPFLLAHHQRTLAGLLAEPGCVLVHCREGKDRTGIAVAAILLALGIALETVLADYLRSRVAGTSEDDMPAAFRNVDRAYFEAAFAAIDAAHGSLNAYTRSILGIDPDLNARLRVEVLEA